MAPDTSALLAAQVNAAIVAIAVAALSAYALILWQALQAQTSKIVDEANRVNERWDWPADLDLIPLAYDSAHRGERQAKIAQLIQALETPFPFKPEKGDDEKKAQLADRIRALIVTLVATYPFPEQFGAGLVLNPPKPVRLDRIKLVEDWVQAVDDVTRRPLQALRDHAQSLGDILQHLSQSEETPMMFGFLFGRSRTEAQALDLGRRLASVNPQNVVGSFLLRMVEVNGLAESTRVKLEQYERLRRLIPKRKTVVSVVALVLAAFLTGVVAPLLHASAPLWLVAWVPAGIYLLGSALGLRTAGLAYRSVAIPRGVSDARR